MATSTDDGNAPDRGQPRTWWQRTGGWLVQHMANIVLPSLAMVVTAVVGIFAGWYAHGQIQAADQQKVISQQEELLTVVLSIEQEPAAEQRATAHLHGALLTNTQVQFENELTSYAQTAQLIIHTMNTQNVSSFAYVQVGKALSTTGNDGQALSYFQDAARQAATADTKAAALRNEGSVRYSLGQPVAAHRDYVQAVRAFSAGHLEVTETDKANNVAQSYLDDASFEIAIGNCPLALADRQGAQQALGTLPDRKRTEVALNRTLTLEDAASYRKRCPG